MGESIGATLDIPWENVESEGAVVVLVRHGRTAWNAQRRFLGSTDIPLDEVGQSGAESLGQRIGGRFDAVFSSPLSRARQTAEYLGTPVERVPALSELRQGDLEGLTMPEGLERYGAYFERWKLEPEVARVPGGGESLGDVRDRAMPAVLRIARGGRGVIAVVTHQMVIATVCCVASGRPLAEYSQWTVGNLGVSVLGLRDGALYVAASGCTV